MQCALKCAVAFLHLSETNVMTSVGWFTIKSITSLILRDHKLELQGDINLLACHQNFSAFCTMGMFSYRNHSKITAAKTTKTL